MSHVGGDHLFCDHDNDQNLFLDGSGSGYVFLVCDDDARGVRVLSELLLLVLPLEDFLVGGVEVIVFSLLINCIEVSLHFLVKPIDDANFLN